MAKKKNAIDLPPNTIVDLVGFKGGQKSILKGITIHDAEQKMAELKKDPKWKKWRFQMFQQGFVK